MSNGTMKLISDYDPNQTKLLPEQWEAIKDQQPGIPFEISDDKIAGRLKFIDIIKSERVDIPKEEREDDSPFAERTRETGRYILSPEGEIYVAYRNEIEKTNCVKEFRDWSTLIIASLGLIVAIIGLLLRS